MGSAQGAFKVGSIYGAVYAANKDSFYDAASSNDGIDFNASRSSALFSGSTLQVPACLALVAIRF